LNYIVKNIFFIILSLFLISSISRTKIKMPKDLIQLSDTTWIDKYEISVRNYYHFLASLRDKEQLDKNLPSPNYINWFDGFWRYDYLYEITDTSLGYIVPLWYKPIVNINKQNAIEYCNWRTENWAELYASLPKKYKKIYPKEVVFRLPTKEEWINAASANLDISKHQYGVKKEKKLNVISIEYFSNKERNDGIFMPTGAADPWKYGLKNDYGIYNMCGDIAEFVSDSNVVMGGSFRDDLENCKVISEQIYENPSDWIGFRCIAEIKR